MKCRGGFSPPDRLNYGLLRGNPPYTLAAFNSQLAVKSASILLPHLILNWQENSPLNIAAFNSQRPLVYPTVGGPTLLQPGTIWLKTLLSDALSANTLHLSDTCLWPLNPILGHGT